VTVTVATEGGERDFPSFSAVVRAPAMPVITHFSGIDDPVMEESPPIGLAVDRTTPLDIAWEAGDGDFMTMVLSPGTGSETPYGKLVCTTEDDGCLRVPSAALGHLALDRAVNFKMRLTRHNRTVWTLEEDGEVLAAADVEASATLEAVVAR